MKRRNFSLRQSSRRASSNLLPFPEEPAAFIQWLSQYFPPCSIQDVDQILLHLKLNEVDMKTCCDFAAYQGWGIIDRGGWPLIDSLTSDVFRFAVLEKWVAERVARQSTIELLPRILSEWERNITSHSLRHIVERLLAIPPDSTGLRYTLLSQGGMVSAWTLAMKHYWKRTDFSCISALRTELDKIASDIKKKELPFADFKLIQGKTSEQLKKFFELVFQENEDPDRLIYELGKCFNRMKAEIEAWTSRIQASANTPFNVFPVCAVDYVSNPISPQQFNMKKCKKKLLRIAFPDVLLHCELSGQMNAREKEELYRKWLDLHSQSFKSYIQYVNPVLTESTKLKAVFTHDDKALEVPPDMTFVHKVELAELQEVDLRESLERFMNEEQQVYILDLHLNAREYLDYVKAVFQEVAQVYSQRNKVLCLLIRTSRKNELNFTIDWKEPWEIATFETLQERDETAKHHLRDMDTLMEWLGTTTKQLLCSDASFNNPKSILQRIYQNLPDFKEVAGERIEKIVQCSSLLEGFKIKLRSRLEDLTCTDWKNQVLTVFESFNEPDLDHAAHMVQELEIATILTPEILAIENYDAFPNFFFAEHSPDEQRIWLDCFQQMKSAHDKVPTDSNLRFPSIGRYYYEHILPYLEQSVSTPADTPKFKLSQDVLSQFLERQDLYLEEVIQLDSCERHLPSETIQIYKALFTSKPTFAKKFNTFLKYRKQIVSLNESQIRDVVNTSQSLKKIGPERWMKELLDHVVTHPHLYSLQPGKLLYFDCLSLKPKSYDLPTNVEMSHLLLSNIEMCSVVLLENGDLFCTGGVENNSSFWHSAVYLKSAFRLSLGGDSVPGPGSIAVTTLQDMKNSRVNHGAVRYEDYVYVFGGRKGNAHVDNENLRLCERFSLVGQQTWEALREMHDYRAYFNPCQFGSDIFLCGGSAKSIEVFHTETQKFENFETLSNVLLPDNSSCFAFMQRNAECVVITASTRSVFDYATRQLSEPLNHSPKYLAWSCCNPVVLGDEVFMVDALTKKARRIYTKTGEVIDEEKFP